MITTLLYETYEFQTKYRENRINYFLIVQHNF